MPHHCTDELIMFVQQMQHVLIVIFVNTTGFEQFFLLSVIPAFSAVISLTLNKIVQNMFS
jgi:hypothetical protein